MGKIREPQKATSIEKKNKIIKAGLDCFCKNGYYNTTTPEIAKTAGVSTGIIYSYFKDKKDIFIQSLDLYFGELYNPMLKEIEKTQFVNLKSTVQAIIQITINSHKKNMVAHEEMVAMSHLDHEIHDKFMEQEKSVVFKIAEILKQKGISFDNQNEKIHIAYNLVENLCHEYVFHKHDFINYDEMIDLTTKLIIDIFK